MRGTGRPFGRLLTGLVLLSWVAAGVAAAAPDRQAQLAARIQHWVAARVPDHQVTVGSLGALSQMPRCRAAPPAMTLYGQGRNRTVRVHCPSQGWQLYVPVTLQSSRRIVVAAHDLAAGTVLDRADIRLVAPGGRSGATGGLAHDPKAVVGETLRAPVGAGTAIHLAGLAHAVRVHAGQSVTVHVRSNAIEIRTTAIALQDGRVGQSILVKNPESGHRYRVQVTAHGVVADLSG